MKVRKCGCIYYEYGPPLLCEKHNHKQYEEQEKGLRKLVRERTGSRGHKLSKFKEYESMHGKWTAFCEHCEKIVIVYDEPVHGDQVVGHPLTEKCSG